MSLQSPFTSSTVSQARATVDYSLKVTVPPHKDTDLSLGILAVSTGQGPETRTTRYTIRVDKQVFATGSTAGPGPVQVLKQLQALSLPATESAREIIFELGCDAAATGSLCNANVSLSITVLPIVRPPLRTSACRSRRF